MKTVDSILDFAHDVKVRRDQLVAAQSALVEAERALMAAVNGQPAEEPAKATGAAPITLGLKIEAFLEGGNHTITDFVGQFPEKTRQYLTTELARLVRDGRIRRVSPGLYGAKKK